MPAREGDTVAVDYTGRLKDGTRFDSSEGRAPLLFTIGAGDVLPMFEQAVIGLEAGESVTVTIPPDEAYGQRVEEAVQVVPVDVFGEGEPPLNAEFNVIADDGQTYTGRVVALSEDRVNVTVDFNHPLAGHELTFEITLAEVVEASGDAS
ncbi:MAG: peptidylprolyl isomerase [Aeromicrobium sp.]|jgi:peptidylprolyl isomerase|nr:peptidylprolyl isomerase [Aeromicrobium sp.]